MFVLFYVINFSERFQEILACSERHTLGAPVLFCFCRSLRVPRKLGLYLLDSGYTFPCNFYLILRVPRHPVLKEFL